MELCSNRIQSDLYTRRDMLRGLSCGFGMLGFSQLAFGQGLLDGANPLAPRATHHEATAKRVIFLFMEGAPSHVDTFDYKPELSRLDGQRGNRNRRLLGSPFKFQQHGESGIPISELFPNVARHADRLCVLNGMHTDIPAHAQAQVQMHTGSTQFVRPSMGSWSLYGLGTENENLPGFVALNPPRNAQNYGAAFLPAHYQGTRMDLGGRRLRQGREVEAMPNLDSSRLTRAARREQLDLVQALNQAALRDAGGTHEGIEGMISAYELAFRMQDTLPEVIDVAKEPESIRDLYGLDDEATSAFGRQCLAARRMAEAGVRFIEVGFGGWDTHRNLREELTSQCTSIDRPIAGLLTDLAQRGLLEDTLVIWGGEFGRTPDAQGTDGRDHNNKGFSMWMAGGGVQGGMVYGATDPLGREAVDGRMHIHDWHATILHMLGLNHERLTYQHAGRDFRLTDVHGEVAKEILRG